MRLHREIMAVLTAEIVDGEPPAGELLPREQDLAARFEVSRGVARECIRALEERGLVRVKHGKGAIVEARSEWDVFNSDVLIAMLAGPLAVELLGEFLECRRIFEVETAGLAAERAAEEPLARARDAFEAMEQATGARVGSKAAEARFHEADVAFHQALIDATGNPALGSLTRRIHDALLAARYPLARPQYRRQQALPVHRAILDAVVAGDAKGARDAMRLHLDTVDGYLRAHARRVAAAA